MSVARLITIAAIRVLDLFGRRLIAISFVVTAVGCVSVPERHPLPPDLIKQASIPGVPNARFWGDEWPTVHKEMLATFGDAELRQFYPGIYAKPHNYLAISGGVTKGAFGAGLLLGWTGQ